MRLVRLEREVLGPGRSERTGCGKLLARLWGSKSMQGYAYTWLTDDWVIGGCSRGVCLIEMEGGGKW